MPEPTVERLLAVGKWLGLNGEAIYGTRPWKIFGEGPTPVAQGEFGEDRIPEFTERDIRFTSRWKTLYAIALDWPKDSGELVVKSLNTHDALLAKGEIASVSLLGSDAQLRWQHDSAGLRIQLPPRKPSDFAYVFKLLLN
jgi:alpha-L-fucosidase